MQKEFDSVLNKVSLELKNSQMIDNKYIRNNNLYAPTEIFAISFEYYLFNLGMNSKAMLSETNYLKQSYFTVFDKCENEIIKYFDNLFPDFKNQIGQSAHKTA